MSSLSRKEEIVLLIQNLEEKSRQLSKSIEFQKSLPRVNTVAALVLQEQLASVNELVAAYTKESEALNDGAEEPEFTLPSMCTTAREMGLVSLRRSRLWDQKWAIEVALSYEVEGHQTVVEETAMWARLKEKFASVAVVVAPSKDGMVHLLELMDTFAKKEETP